MAETFGYDEPAEMAGDHESGSEIDNPEDTFAPRFLYAFRRLGEQRIAHVEPANINHAARVAADRVGVSPELRVVRLRQRDEHRNGEPAAKQWQHRWVVRMHKVLSEEDPLAGSLN